ncbi:hypothetical protein TNCV_1173811 [Trichonephila clavipes]|uniref:Uncharacterized protein n=1 Tax=Trichonephila clavipes TaxID=2585209 RepID=A0A8X6VET1_TRICX|nr:hypothetical protein TNCV_1173811 [Trichonephila clavipes]
MGSRLSFTIIAARLDVVTPRVQTINNDPMATCTGHFTAGGSIKSRDNRWVAVATRIKLDQILEIADKLHMEIIALQDSKLCEQRLLNAKGYNIVRRDRASGGGGLMFFIRDVHFQRLPDTSNDTSDLEH